MKKLKWSLLISGILVTILGILMLFYPTSSYLSIALYIGLSMIISGVSEILSFCTDNKENRSGWLLSSGIISTLLGLWVFFGKGVALLAIILPFVFATWVFASGVIRISGAISLYKTGSKIWGWVLTLGILCTISGFILLFSPLYTAILMVSILSFTLILHGINNTIVFFHMNKNRLNYN